MRHEHVWKYDPRTPWAEEAAKRLEGKRQSELTEAEFLDASELWVRRNMGHTGGNRDAIAALLLRIDQLRAQQAAPVAAAFEGGVLGVKADYA